MVLVAILLFCLAAPLGLYLLYLLLLRKETPKGLAITHGQIAFFGILFLFLYTVIYSSRPWPALVLFLLAACGGAILILRDLTGKKIPWWLAVGHGSTAVIALILLICLM